LTSVTERPIAVRVAPADLSFAGTTPTYATRWDAATSRSRGLMSINVDCERVDATKNDFEHDRLHECWFILQPP